jgi:molybdopterin-containing oxidoreductase family iron-sulfur binding subunit
LVTCYDGRPVKVEGNPKHPESRGATDGFAQAAVLELYDPDRSRRVIQQSQGQTVTQRDWERFTQVAQAHFAELRTSNGAGLRVLSEMSSSPTLAILRQRLLTAFPEAQWHQYEPISRDNELAGTKLLFGKPYRPLYDLSKAEVIVCLDADLLGAHPACVRYAREFADRRELAGGKMNRLYAVESCYSITGAAADHRLPLRSREIGGVAAALRAEVLALKHPEATGRSLRASREPVESTAREMTFVRAVARDLVNHRGASLVVAGPGQPPEVHALVQRLNHELGNTGETVAYAAEPAWSPCVDSIKRLADDMRSGKVDTLVILGGNPVYNAPADVQFAAALEKVSTTIHLGLYRDETGRQCVWHLPQAHFLESWGDARGYDGTYSVVQPMIEPLYGGKSAIELVALLLGEKTASGYDLVRQTFREIAGEADFEQRWQETVHDGLLADSHWPRETPSLKTPSEDLRPLTPGSSPAGGEGSFATAATPKTAAGVKPLSTNWLPDDLEIVFCRDASVYDGRLANNGWLQEAPDPMTRLTLDNALLISPATAAKLGVQDSTLVKLRYAGREVEIPAYVMPGQAAGSVAVSLGYGRVAAGQVGGSRAHGVEPVGVDVYPLRTSRAMYFAGGATIEPTGRPYRLACVQDHHAIDTVGRRARDQRLGELVREVTLQRYTDKEHPYAAEAVVHHPPLKSLWDEPPSTGHRWGMSIDLSKCIGCNACVVACHAENNIPVVGKERVLEGREMHWIRIDRYFKGDAEDPQVAHQPVLCQQCENAPCEQVCPVAATVHSREGLNDMVYNRCVGTRYCANNCPYKVRRFNFFYYHWDLEKPENQVLKMVYNPEVTVRSRGVMEKCTYCVQRIQAVKIDAKNHSRPIADGQIQTACQQACPTQAIVFGDLSDQASRVARLQASDRAYGMLAELNVRPRTRYLARVRNPNPELPSSDDEHHGHIL